MEVVHKELQPFTWSDAAYLAPEWILIAVAIALVILDLAMPSRISRTVIGWLTLSGLLTSLAFVIWRLIDLKAEAPTEDPLSQIGTVIRIFGDSYRIDGYSSMMKIIFLVAAALIVLISIGTVKEKEIPNKGEYYYLLLPAVVGAMVMVSSSDLITLYVGLELLSITTYILVGMRKYIVQSAEAAFKYVVTGGISSALLLFGISYLYGVSGTTNLGLIGEGAVKAGDMSALMYVGLFFVLAGFGIKIAAAPFHLWAPDVYQGAPTPISAFLGVISKAAALAVLFRIVANVGLLGSYTQPIMGDVTFAVLIMAAAAMIAGTTAALRQHNMKRLLALSGVANAGYLLVPVGLGVSGMHTYVGEFIFYLVIYLFMNIGAFAVLSVISKAAGHEEMRGFGGLYYRAPWTAVATIVFVLSLAGLPITGGFFGKLFILLGAAQAQNYWIIAIMIVTSVISYYFYFGIIRQMFMRSTGEAHEITVPATTGIVIWLSAAVIVLLGFIPGAGMDIIHQFFSFAADMLILYL
ncbi:NAD(P)H-quinone oxidoreductase subunit 2, chloroplastic [Paenibacillus plantiphilus]|uniref:NADH-quinone oxidoreductase subunit N n=1 Tax=Paenibacillus plantiphilus TaxID=2905650 RepID=A0ABM9BUE7_9BACL|nr:NADH-quinone oxidoreductase subunit N [Paenibacillus plantiphilus]CAH1193243.1 NAD(P)H-quinone oxidoreductase subunit 2, chloroplastic [Paenibacillus plantiphilus]